MFIVAGTASAIVMAWRGDSQGTRIQRKIDRNSEQHNIIINNQQEILRILNKTR